LHVLSSKCRSYIMVPQTAIVLHISIGRLMFHKIPVIDDELQTKTIGYRGRQHIGSARGTNTREAPKKVVIVGVSKKV